MHFVHGNLRDYITADSCVVQEDTMKMIYKLFSDLRTSVFSNAMKIHIEKS